MNCPECGAEVQTDAANCPECGAEVFNREDGREITAKLEVHELEEQWKKKAAEPLKVQAVVKLGARTDLGRVRENNEDKFDFFEPEDEPTLAVRGSFYAVADGMGGHAAGQIASELGLKTVINSYYGDTTDSIQEALIRAAQQANSLIYDTAQAIVERSGMGTTLTAAIVRGDELYVLQVGDSRAYLIRGGRISQMTQDHSWVCEQVRLGALTEEEARCSPFRNVITRSLGAAPGVEPDVYQERLKEGDVIVLCSDGLSGNLSADDIRRMVNDKGPSLAARDMVDLANDRGGNDNITVVVLAIREIHEVEGTQTKPRRSKLRRLLSRD